MASYPTAVKVFVSRNAGDVIQPAHINDLQDEVNAIEAGLLQGTAALNSSNSTVANLSVLGGSTFTGNVVMNGTLTVSGLSAALANVKVSHSAAQQIPGTAWTALNWDTEAVDASGMHSTSVNSSRITFADSTGMYAVGASIQWSTGNATFLAARILFNDSSVSLAHRVYGSPTYGVPMTVHGLVQATSTADYVTVQGFTDSSSGSIAAASTGAPCAFWAVKVSK